MKNMDEERLEHLLETKEYQALTHEEKELVHRMIGSEEQYRMMRNLDKTLLSAEEKSGLMPDPIILTSVKALLKEKKGSGRPSFFTIKIPAYATVILVIVCSAITGIVTSRSVQPPQLTNETAVRTDTIFFSKVDTVFRERVVYRPASVSKVTGLQAAHSSDKEKAKDGVTMNDKEELNKLLVSGSD